MQAYSFQVYHLYYICFQPARMNNEVSPFGDYYHVFNRGVESITIFRDEQDFDTFLGYLKEYLSEAIISDNAKKEFVINGRSYKGVPHQPKNFFNKIYLVGYSLTSNEFHIVLKIIDNISLESFVRSLATRYSIYFNKKYQKKGSLFQESSRVIKIANFQELNNLINEIHQNKDNHSSYFEYTGKKETPWIKTETLLNISDNATNTSSTSIGTTSNEKDLFRPMVQEIPEKMNTTTTYSKPAGFKILAYISFLVFLLTISNLLKSNVKDLIIISSLSAPIALFFVMEFAKPKEINVETKPRKLVLLTTILMFLILFNISLTRVKAIIIENERALAFAKFEKPKVISASTQNTTTEVSPTPSISASTPTPEPTISAITQALEATNSAQATHGATISATQQQDSVKRLVIKITDGSPSVDIRKSPSLSSSSISQAKDGEIFFWISESDGWYQIELTEGLTGFVSNKYVEILVNLNN